MTLHLRPDQEQRIEEAIRAGLIDSFDQVIEAGLEKFSLPRHKTAKTAQEAAEHIREARKGNFLPEEMTIRSMINEGRA